ncbi:MAG: hypothetical protein K2Y33_03240 [Mycolicibacterium frederiksbergense]|nr:hypothetical protein [Mycolicibacterium frederiksbergense]
MAAELRTLVAASGPELETRARCQDDGHPVGAVHPYWFGGHPGSFCHCGRVIYRGSQPVVRWPRPPMRTIIRGVH